ncbi:hypothetical protein [Amnibacterium sp.]|uniref:hypothetical protein n=1 Tax=Amnibacterium sp. TaxID=1872496 RepID=UPI003F7BCCDF
MAKIRTFTFRRAAAQAHPTEVDATWAIAGSGPEALVQISTYGSDGRQSQPKVSQTIQIDEAVAAQLIDVLVDAFGERIIRQR